MKIFKRENYLSRIRGIYNSCNIIKVITGIRRCGKSCLMQSIIDELLANGITKEQIIYINLEKKGYKYIRNDDELEKVIDSLTKNINKTKYLFIDEIQRVKNFEEVIEAYRLEEDYSIFITGSNSYLLSGELMTLLTGRYIEFEIYTLSFEEYLQMKEFYKLPIDNNLMIELDNYINEGGFPESVFLNSLSDKRTYSQSVVNEIINKDIRRRVKIRKIETFNLVMNYIFNNFGSTTSLNNILTGLNKNGFVIGKPTLLKYVQCLLDAKLLYKCDRFDMKSRRMLQGEKKYYLADLSLCFVSNPDSRINYGPSLENIIYIYAKSHNYEVSIGRIGKLECDFIFKDMFLNYSYIQVAYTIHNSKKTEDREYTPLELIKDNYPKYVITTDYLMQKRNGIIHINLMEHLKNGKIF